MAKNITKVPDGPLVKKKGPFKGSTLKAGGKIKKAQNGKTWQSMSQPEKASKVAELKQKGGFERVKQYKDSISEDVTNRMTSAFAKGAERRGLTVDEYSKKVKKDAKAPADAISGGCGFGKERTGCARSAGQRERWLKEERNRKNGGPIKKAKAGVMIKRADGSFSKRGLWDNIRANKGSGKKPTAAMLKQEKKIKAKTKK